MRVIIAFICGLWAVNVAPAFAETPYLSAFQSGARATYDSRDNAKAFGREVTFQYPANWQIGEAARPHIVQKAIANDGSNSQCLLSIVVSDDLHKADIAKLATDKTQMPMLAPNGATVISATPGKLGTWPAAELVLAMPTKSADGATVYTHSINYFTGFEKTFVIFQCVTTGLTPEEASTKFDQYIPLFRAISGTVVIHELGAE